MTRIAAFSRLHHTSRRTFLHAVMAASAVVALLPGRPAHADVLANIQKAGVIRVAIPNDFPPFGSLGPDLKLQGYDIDMANLVAKELGVKAELVPVTSTNRIPFLTTGKVDIVISSLGKNAERAKVIDFTQAYAPFPKSVYGPKDASIKKPADLAGKTIGVTRGSTEDLALSAVAPASATIKRYEDNNATAQSYLIGQVQLVTVGNIVANAVNERTKLRQLDLKFPVEDTPCYVGVAKGEPALLDKVNAAITKLKTDGRLNDLSQRWIKMPLPAQL
ncbi:transporter substrate-binding domain-containing protein [Ralstonia insidiosa]|jgi:polar amino acid transport system substrate-binding protein|uniref:transporter substrate-binding domain-containing protein n=1 Tax=Ralstonia TaxID=48736 RepID=UPI00066481BC|nr:transporter substrate-binding domain-containing protein [Ralstonia insidiosa]KMW46108.1 amino acid ABC transporter substrate-binding protein [Ralstonia sp. MD27]MBX3774256.1 transporter substrate-binding domain-containing protein [Ralstonia pickettii]NOZ17446.1 transporter substrate-binding domain-containing protein [Betaproteobacteria bacterium]MBA9858091.1 amino acid ABC transporter substrate-binding protein [Ralstonia insidiosa]MBA9871905.1 amino acid ABC transporter substrate-binding pr